MDKWTEYLEIGGQMDVIYTDLEKAFDKVPHQRLLLKLKSYNIHDDIIQWISSFLQSRSQRVVLNNNCSDWSESGIPHSTRNCTWPITLLNIHQWPPTALWHYRWIILVCRRCKNFSNITSTADHVSLQSSLDNLITWSNNWLLKLNTQKCKVASYGKNPDQSFIYTVTENNITYNIERVNVFKDSGVWFDTKLSFSTHCHEKN